MSKIAEGAKAPDFTIESAAGPIRLADFAGKTFVLYFYPKDDTTGCTSNPCDWISVSGDTINGPRLVVIVPSGSVPALRTKARRNCSTPMSAVSTTRCAGSTGKIRVPATRGTSEAGCR